MDKSKILPACVGWKTASGVLLIRCSSVAAQELLARDSATGLQHQGAKFVSHVLETTHRIPPACLASVLSHSGNSRFLPTCHSYVSAFTVAGPASRTAFMAITRIDKAMLKGSTNDGLQTMQNI